MLKCGIDLKALTKSGLECGLCSICVAKSKLNYPFAKDLRTSNDFVKALKLHIEATTVYKCIDTKILKNPDIAVIDVIHSTKSKGNLICRVEGKLLEGYAFMKAEQLLKDHLKPKETLVIDEPKLLSYFETQVNDLRDHGKSVPIYIVWKFDRPCAILVGVTVFQEISVLKSIYQSQGNNRRFERKTVQSDMEHDVKLGVTKKYHFSLKECRPIEELPMVINLL